MFKSFDKNINLYCTFIEIFNGIRKELNLDGKFDTKPAIFRAFAYAKNSSSVKSKYGAY